MEEFLFYIYATSCTQYVLKQSFIHFYYFILYSTKLIWQTLLFRELKSFSLFIRGSLSRGILKCGQRELNFKALTSQPCNII